ncbi:MAG: hypothetical protein Ct9H90mP16_01770 [Candidatus Poseidoniales archaeon]|nr:MAG: hypothetical protein Ct9H90mP16_01770 [Candidatus Poseidoniales archaeon]
MTIDRIARFAEQGYECHGGLSDLLGVADVVVDCAPGKMGAENLSKYQKAGIKYMFQGGEKHALTGLSYTSSANHARTSMRKGLEWSPATPQVCHEHWFHCTNTVAHSK